LKASAKVTAAIETILAAELAAGGREPQVVKPKARRMLAEVAPAPSTKSEKLSKTAQNYWDKMTDEQKKKEMARRVGKRQQTVKLDTPEPLPVPVNRTDRVYDKHQAGQILGMGGDSFYLAARRAKVGALSEIPGKKSTTFYSQKDMDRVVANAKKPNKLGRPLVHTPPQQQVNGAIAI
jgi:hypothetical protein